MVARWKPVHRGHAVVLRALSDRAEQALIGIGSSNRYDSRNPFTRSRWKGEATPS
jgi:nicotinamide-nucleotide adenylyltransferase